LIANSFVFKEPVFNYSGDFPFLWDEIKIPIHFGSDYTKTKEILKRIGNEVVGDPTTESKAKWLILQNKYKLEDARTTPMVSIVITDKSVEYTLRYVVEYKKRRETKTELFARILVGLENLNGEIKIT
jgi:small-conductance mechanosensitive channel